MIDTRPATPDDLADIHAMIDGLSAFHGDTASITREALKHAFFGTAPKAFAFIAEINGAPVGYAGLIPTFVLHTGETRFDIHHLFVAQNHRKTGVATALIAAARDYANTVGATRLSIGTDPDNATSIGAYRAMSNLTEITGFGPRFWVDLGD